MKTEKGASAMHVSAAGDDDTFDYLKAAYGYDPSCVVIPASLLDPLPPTKLSAQPYWSQNQTTPPRCMSNARLVAECISISDYMEQAWEANEDRLNGSEPDEKEYWLNDTVR